MEDIGLVLRAKNSSGVQTLTVAKDGEEFYFTLNGSYKGQIFQIDFDTLSRSELEDVKIAIELMLEA